MVELREFMKAALDASPAILEGALLVLQGRARAVLKGATGQVGTAPAPDTLSTTEPAGAGCTRQVASDVPLYAIRLTNHRIWEITFEGRTTHFRDLKGFHYVAHLLRRPPEVAIHGTDLAAQVFGYASIPELSLGKEMEADRQALLRRARELAEVVSSVDASEMEKEEARQELEELEAATRRLSRNRESNAERVVRSVRRAIHRAHDECAGKRDDKGRPHPVLVPFAKHLDVYLLKPSARGSERRGARVRAGIAGRFTYEPPAGVVWS